jgi:ubiquinone/menaquinone biosynthesis C-methylase UbiE
MQLVNHQLPQPPRVTPAPIIETTFAFSQSCALLAAVELEVFTWIGRGMNTASLMAEHTHASEQALIRLLNTLCAMKFLQHTAEGYALTSVSAQFLDKEKPSYLGDVAKQIRNEWDAWIDLTKAIQTGHSLRRINQEPLGGRFFAEMVDHLFPIVYPIMNAICKRLGIGTQLRGARVLDLGSGNAPSAIAVLQHDPEARAVAMDFQRVLEEARACAGKHGVNDRMTYEVADLEVVELPAESYDLIFASHVFRILGSQTTQHLLQQSYQSLKAGGRLVIVETYNNPEDEALFPKIVSLNMFVNAQNGDAFSLQEMKDWVTNSGFQVEMLTGVAPDPVLVAVRA